MKEKIHIRQAELQDLDAIEHWLFSQKKKDRQNEILKRSYIKRFKRYFLKAECQGQILGYLEGPVRMGALFDRFLFSEVEDLSHLEQGFISITGLSIAKEAQGLRGWNPLCLRQ